jgi:SAM-dependent methyltransferase
LQDQCRRGRPAIPNIGSVWRRLASFTRRLLQKWRRLGRKLRPLRQRVAFLEGRLAQFEAQQHDLNAALYSRISELAIPGQRLTLGEIDNALRTLGQKLSGNQPQYSYLNLRLRDYELAILNIKNLGYELGRILAERELQRPQTEPSTTQLKSKLCTQSDFESDWLRYWCQEIRTVPFYHRKLWEFCFICQALFVEGALTPGRKGLGFGCGEEPLPSLFAKYGVKVLATDLDPARHESEVWRMTGQHSASVETFRRRDICPDEQLLANIDFQPIDMNALPRDFGGQFDFCWSACAFEHLGSLANGLVFVENSLRSLKPGGIAVHTTEFTFADGETLDNWPTVLYQKRHLLELADRLRAKGYQVEDFDFDPGSGIIDRFIDLPPDLPPWSHEPLTPGYAHLKLSIDGFTCTSAGIIIRA